MHSNKIFKASNEIFCKFGASVVTLPAELLLEERLAALMIPLAACSNLFVSFLAGHGHFAAD